MIAAAHARPMLTAAAGRSTTTAAMRAASARAAAAAASAAAAINAAAVAAATDAPPAAADTVVPYPVLRQQQQQQPSPKHGRRRPRATGAAPYSLPWSPLHARVQRAAAQRRLLPRGARVLVAVSGGQDSMCLAQLLLDLAPTLGLAGVSVAHCDHRMRPDSAACAARVREWARARGAPYFEAAAARAPRGEAAARAWRYARLEALARAAGAGVVAVGHTATDRAETLLLNALRGAGADGLAAMAWRRPLLGGSGCGDEDGGGGDEDADGDCESGWRDSEQPVVQLVRPLLELTREETAAECARRRLPVWEDPTNRDAAAAARNALRLRALPELEAVNARAVPHLAALAELLAADVQALEDAARAALRRACEAAAASDAGTSGGAGGGSKLASLDRASLLGEPLALQRRALRRWLRAGLGRAPTFEQVEEARSLLSAPAGASGSTLPGGAWVRVAGGVMMLTRSTPAPQKRVLWRDSGSSGSGSSGIGSSGRRPQTTNDSISRRNAAR